MSAWRREAIRRIPKLKGLIEEADGPMALWIDLRSACEDAMNDPVDEETIAGIYDYAAWCLLIPRRGWAMTAVVVAFYEDLPTRKLLRRSMPQWLTRMEFNGIKQVFYYHLSPQEVTDLVDEFNREKPRYPDLHPLRSDEFHGHGFTIESPYAQTENQSPHSE
jgi:hypothetical protein